MSGHASFILKLNAIVLGRLYELEYLRFDSFARVASHKRHQQFDRLIQLLPVLGMWVSEIMTMCSQVRRDFVV